MRKLKDGRVRTTVRFKAEIHKEIKAACVTHDYTIEKFVEYAVTNLLERIASEEIRLPAASSDNNNPPFPSPEEEQLRTFLGFLQGYGLDAEDARFIFNNKALCEPILKAMTKRAGDACRSFMESIPKIVGE